jgi:hypothetical protein
VSEFIHDVFHRTSMLLFPHDEVEVRPITNCGLSYRPLCTPPISPDRMFCLFSIHSTSPTRNNGSNNYPRRSFSVKASLGILDNYRAWHYTPDCYWRCWWEQSLWSRYLTERRPQYRHCCYQSGDSVTAICESHSFLVADVPKAGQLADNISMGR